MTKFFQDFLEALPVIGYVAVFSYLAVATNKWLRRRNR